jgi:hypothetical protein
MIVRTTPDNISSLESNEIFVFGSNRKGIHGAGAARLAYKKFGAEWGVDFGSTGRTFAIPTKDLNIKTLPIKDIKLYVELFLSHAKAKKDLIFLVTQIGCGLAGYTPKDIAPLFKGATSNVILPQVFHDNM